MVHALTLPAHSELEKTERGPFSGMAAYLWSRNTDIQEFRNVRPFHRSTGTLRFFIRPQIHTGQRWHRRAYSLDGTQRTGVDRVQRNPAGTSAGQRARKE